MPDDPIDAAEARLARRLQIEADPPALRADHGPAGGAGVDGAGARVDGGGGRGSPDRGRLGWLLTGTAVLAGITAVALLANAMRGPNAAASPTGQPGASASGGIATCRVEELGGRILGWEGAAGSLIASVTLTSTAATACRLMDYRLALADGSGRGLMMILGQEVQPGIELAPGRAVSTSVQVSNYCLAATPREPVSLQLEGAEGQLVFAPAADGSSGVPPCNGPGQPGSISQQPWQEASG